VASAIFHWHFAGPAGVAPIIALAIVTYATGLALSRDLAGKYFAATCMLLVGTLIFYKYSEFGLDIVGTLATSTGVSGWSERAWTAPAAPLAVSFFTFEFVHYLYEVRVRGREPIRNPIYFAVFAIFFPSLASGPIKRFPDFVPQLSALANPTPSEAWAGARRVIRGLFKKICIADILVEFIRVFEEVPSYTGPVVVSLAVLQGFRIYYDFAGYSDMAIGLAQMLNLKIPENFDRPYLSTSLQDFWRRWHMSLSSWIRDYIYIPLGGNRKNRTVNVMIAIVLCGLWHGAAWNFAAWGLFHGVGLTLESVVHRMWPALFEAHGPIKWARWAVCYSWVCYGWLLFFYPIGTVARMTTESIGWLLGG
jgi:alginate O-acetyltransferase complex protein AlgI